MQIDLENIDEVINAIGNYDSAMADSIHNLKNEADNCEVEMAEDEPLKQDLPKLIYKFALETYRSFKKNERCLAEEKADDLWTRYTGVPQHHRESGCDEYDAYSDAEAEAEDLRTEEETITEHITAMMFGDYIPNV